MPHQDTTSQTFRVVEVKLYPSKQQAETLSQWMRVCCRIYNQALEHRIKGYKRRKESPSLYDQQKLLTKWRSRSEEIRDVPSVFARDALRRVDRGMKAFFQRCKEGAKKKGFPRFKASHRWRSMECLSPLNYTNGQLVYVPILGPIRFRGRKLEGLQRSLKIIRRETGWYAHLLVAGPADPVAIEPQSAVGIDVGLTTFAALSTGELIANPRFMAKSSRKLRIAQRRACRKVKGSRNRNKSFRKVARIHERVKAQRRDFAHQLSRQLVSRFDLIGVEDLNIKGLAASALAKPIADAAWGIFLIYLIYKAASAGKSVVKVNPSGTSQACPECGQVKKKELSERVHRCECGCVLDRDVAASRVILDRALAVAGRTSLPRGSPLGPVLRPAASEPDEEGSPMIAETRY